ncbi:ABC transporter ATP-binding protein [Alcaligenaceae bacterium]|nr:ABC transporter ATP-binding protein [Alcaligenaceae bacterium]
MIELRNITKSYLHHRGGRKVIFRDLSLVIPAGINIGLIGRNGAGKSTMMRLLCGLDTPDSGQIITDKSISWPVGLSGGFQGSLTARENVKFVCRVQGARGAELHRLVKYVEDFADIGEYFDLPVKTYSSGMRGRVAFGLSLAFDFDYYLVDEAMSTGDAHFKKKAADAFKERTGKANVILVTHGMTQVRTMCDIVLLLEHGKVIQFDDVEEGIAAYQKGAS